MNIFEKVILYSYLVFCLFILSVFTGCTFSSQNDNLTDIPEYTVSPGDAVQHKISPLIHDLEYIRLQLPNETFFREAKKILSKDSTIYIFESALNGSNPKIFSFDLTGGLNYVIDRPGRGPGEYERIYDFGLTESSLVLSSQTELMFFDRKNGDYIKSEDISKGSFLQSFAMINDKVVVQTASNTKHNQSKNLVKFYALRNEKSLHEAIPFEDHALKSGHSYRYIYSYNDSLSVIPEYDQTVYRIVADPEVNNYSVHPAYRFNFGDSWIPEELLADSYNNRGRFFGSAGDYVHTVDIFETEDVIYATYVWQGDNYTFIQDKHNNKSLNISGFTENATGWVGKPEEVYNNRIVNLVHPAEIEKSEVSSNTKLMSILNNPDANKDPILILSKFQLN